jgi:hypothetical protein
LIADQDAAFPETTLFVKHNFLRKQALVVRLGVTDTPLFRHRGSFVHLEVP